MKLMCDTEHGAIQWRWKGSGSPSAEYKSLNYQWWFPKKSDFELVTKVDAAIRQEVIDEIWEDMQEEIEYFKRLYKLHKSNKKGRA